jgi:hypothetical protein
MLERLKTVMLGLWYPAVLGALIVLFFERWAEGGSAAARPSTWFGLFIILYYTILFEESVHTHDYTLYAWVLDFFDLGVMYTAYAFLGYGFGGKYQNIKWFYGIMVYGFVEPMIWRSLEKKPDRFLDLLCFLAVIVMLLGFPTPEAYTWVALIACWVLFITYIVYVCLRVARIRPAGGASPALAGGRGDEPKAQRPE